MTNDYKPPKSMDELNAAIKAFEQQKNERVEEMKHDNDCETRRQSVAQKAEELIMLERLVPGMIETNDDLSDLEIELVKLAARRKDDSNPMNKIMIKVAEKLIEKKIKEVMKKTSK